MDNNPYKTPRSDVEIAEKPVRSVWWKIYFAVFALLLIASVPDLLLAAGAGFVDWVYLLFLLASVTGLFGYVFMKRIFTARVWLPVLVAVFLADVVYPFATAIDLSAGVSREVYLAASAFGWLLSLPNYAALYLYSKPGNPIWRQPGGAGGRPPG